MRNGHNAALAQQLVAGEIGHIAANLSVLEGGEQIGVVDQLAARQIDQRSAPLHLEKYVLVKGRARGVQ